MKTGRRYYEQIPFRKVKKTYITYHQGILVVCPFIYFDLLSYFYYRMCRRIISHQRSARSGLFECMVHRRMGLVICTHVWHLCALLCLCTI